MIHLVGKPIIGTSVNPARSLGPALVAGGTALTQLWVFIAAVVWKYLLEETGSAV